METLICLFCCLKNGSFSSVSECASLALQRISHLGFFSSQCFPRDVPWWSGALAQSLLLHLQFAAVVQILQYEHGASLEASPSGVCQDFIFMASNRNSAFSGFKVQVTVPLEIFKDVFYLGVVPPMSVCCFVIFFWFLRDGLTEIFPK